MNPNCTTYFVLDVWSGHRSSDKTQDRLATSRLIEILKSYQENGELFANRKMRRKDVWTEIASQLMSEGFSFCNKEHAWEKVSQKWRNMERSYRMHVHNVRSKGLSLDSITMEFFDDLHELLAGKYHTESMLLDSSSSFDLSNASQNEGDEADESMEMINGELVEYYDDDEEEQLEEESAVSVEPILMEAELCSDTYVEDEIPPPSPTFSDNKHLVFTSSDQEIDISSDRYTAGVRDPVLRLLLEMRAQERAHFREDRRERLKMQRETLDFRRDLVHLLNQHHQERMEVMHSLIAAIGGSLGAKVTNPLPNGNHHKGAQKDEKDLPLKSSRQNNLS